ncbi:DUF6454 family protein [Flindersiella endophytica]
MADTTLAGAIRRLDRTTQWREVQRIPLRFATYHPQGMTLAGDRIFLSSVEIGADRDHGTGHVLVLDRGGRLLDDVRIGEEPIYHPGGIDFDGESVWVPVAEYRPHSKAIVYTMDPGTYELTERFRVDDHIGGVVRDQITGDVHGVSWGGRTLYTWTPDGRQLSSQGNEDHLLDYQDGAYVADSLQVCTGITGLPAPGGGTYELGGIVLRDLRDNRILHQVPLPLFSTAGHVLTRNPVAFELDGDTLRLLAAPDDGEEPAGTELYILETTVLQRSATPVGGGPGSRAAGRAGGSARRPPG